MADIFEKFCDGTIVIQGREKRFTEIDWTNHPAYEGVSLKHLLTSSDTEGCFSYHLVRIAPGKSIGLHVHQEQTETHEVIAGSGLCRNDGEEYGYMPGTMSLFPAGKMHEILAGEEGLSLFAKFFRPLC